MENIKRYTNILMFILIFTPGYTAAFSQENNKEKGYKMPWIPDNGDGSYKNPVIYSDYSDPDVIQVDDNYYLVASSFNAIPALPILHSKDLVNWKIISYVSDCLPFSAYDKPQHGKGVWAPSIRFHDGFFWVYYGDPDFGLMMAKTKDPYGPWEPLKLVKEAKGWIDPCPLWDDDGTMYLVHAWAKSRVGFNSILTVNKLSPDGSKILDEGVMVFDGNKNHPTMEGPKFYKRNGYYYIFAPAGGVPQGWQTILRSKNIYGPYEDKIVLHQGNTNVNGPHQGGWIDTKTGESWFIHFQDKGAYGRIVHLQPMEWVNDWPVMGKDINNDGIGEPVYNYKKPVPGNEIIIPQTSDDFKSGKLGFQWQWQANYKKEWYQLTDNNLRMFSIPVPEDFNSLWDVPNLLLQKFPAPEFTIETKLIFNPISIGEISGLIIMGMDYSYIGIEKTENGLNIIKSVCHNAEKNGKEMIEESIPVKDNNIFLRIDVKEGALCNFSYSIDGREFNSAGKEFQAKKGMWIGAKTGIFNIAPNDSTKTGYSDFKWFKVK